jgi:hypothetical protein
MKTFTTSLLAAIAALILGASCVPVGVGVDYDDGLGYPPDAYVATAVPYYYGGVPYYWYGGHWFLRDGGGWHGYRSEPGFLHGARPIASARMNYGRGAYYGHAARFGGGGGHHR